ncbi:TetR/AcrR family transcriptional regulator [Arthrobacter cryoconiti]|uniref:TetR/AcrR family transcriptional regulator n=1 Tax=Arthrobacter cryoconiti TaxID=748907 RepID=A0ABV8R309_9MICC|nr:TetR/AcrR family transcriptional regulator [Arthrobacter cryoconiti]MCC9067766.1 TetR/AcrR family transcriptional regulator [Arthrobacter cryoconiti]
MNTSGNARARVRATLTREILDVARHQLAAVGANALSLRAVAQEMEMVPSGLYRYFASRDVLLTALIIEAYDALGDQAERALLDIPADDYRNRWLTVCGSVRDWALAHPQEFILIYGSPVTNYRAPADTIAPAARVYTLLLNIVNDSVVAGRFESPATEPAMAEPAMDSGLTEDAVALLSSLNISSLSPATLLRAITAWSHVLGAISQELFGHLDGAFREKGHLFEYTAELMVDFVGLRAEN